MSAADETASCCLLLHFKQRDRLRHIADWTQVVHASRKLRALPFGVFDIVYVALSRSSDRAFAFQVSIPIFPSFPHAGHPSGVVFFLFGGDGNCEREEVSENSDTSCGAAALDLGVDGLGGAHAARPERFDSRADTLLVSKMRFGWG
jgi:hypothetical protein